MKNLTLAKISAVIFGSSIVQIASAQATEAIATASANCEVNGQPVPCDQVFNNPAFQAIAGFGIFFIILMIVLGIFWLIMLIHAIVKPIENKPLWIIVLLLFGPLGAIVYYFAIKRPFTKIEKETKSPKTKA